MPDAPGYKGLRRTANREALLDAAADLIGAQGLSDVSIDDIVHHAGVAKGTFYNHFKDKTDIAHFVALGVRQDIRDQIAKFRSVTPDPALRLSIALTLFLGLALDHPRKAHILVTMLTGVSEVAAPMNERVRATLEMGKVLQRFSFRSLDAAFIFVLGVVVGGVRSILEQDNDESADALIGDLIAHCLMGLGLSKAEARSVSKLARDHVQMT